MKLTKAMGCALAGQFIVIGICFLIYPYFNVFTFLMKVPSWYGIPLLILASLLFQWSVRDNKNLKCP